MVYYDSIGHMIADSKNELHAFAKRIGLRREWYQEKGDLSHYDLTTPRAMRRAEAFGAVKISPRDLVRQLRGK